MSELLGAIVKSNSQYDFTITRNNSAEINVANKVLIILFNGHATKALPAFILANNSGYSVLGALPSTFNLSIADNKLTIDVGNTAYYESLFKYYLF